MIEAFFNDKSVFRLKIIVILLISTTMLVAGIFVSNMAKDQLLENRRLAKQYLDERQWMNSFNFKKAKLVMESILNPALPKEVETVHNQQLKILADNGVEVIRANKGRMLNTSSRGKGKTAGAESVVIQVEISSKWPNLVRALNEFERKNLVIITSADLATSDSVTIKGRIIYEIFYSKGKKS